jgi:CheY-like chemotaxis protein
VIDIDFLLCVEDDPSNRLGMKPLVEKTLNARNYAIFEDSADFISGVQSLPAGPDIILLDIHVSPLNGFQMFRMIRDDPVYCDTKVVALTASVMNEEIERLRKSGIDLSIKKHPQFSFYSAQILHICPVS